MMGYKQLVPGLLLAGFALAACARATNSDESEQARRS